MESMMNDISLQNAIQLIKSGKQSEALSILNALVKTDPHDEKAWVWLIQALPIDQRSESVGMFFKENPNSLFAQKAVEAIYQRENPERPAEEEGYNPELRPQAEVSEVFAEANLDSSAQLSTSIRNEMVSPKEIDHRQPVVTPQVKKWEFHFFPDGLLVIVLAAILVLVLIITTQKGFFTGLNIQNPTPTRQAALTTLANVDRSITLTANAKQLAFTPSTTATEEPIVLPSTPSMPLDLPNGSVEINTDNAKTLTLFSKATTPQTKVILSPSLRYILPLERGSQVRLLDFNSLGSVFAAYLPSDSMANAAFSPNEVYLAVLVTNGDIILYDILEKKDIRILRTGKAVLANTGFLVFSPDSRLLAAVLAGSHFIWDLSSGEVIGTGGFLTLPIVFNSQMIFLSCEPNICAEDISTGKELRQYAASANATSARFALSPVGDWLSVATQGDAGLETITIYNIVDGSIKGVIQTGLSRIWEMAYSPDGHIIAVWGALGTSGQHALILLDAEKMSNLNAVDIGPITDANSTVEAKDLFFTPDGNVIAAITAQAILIFSVP